MKEFKEQAENGFGFTSGKKLFANQLYINLGKMEYRKAGAKDGSHNWPVLRVRFEIPETTKYWEDDLNFRNAFTPKDVEAIADKTIVDFEGFWGSYVEKTIDPKTHEMKVEVRDADYPKVLSVKFSDGTTFTPSGAKIEFGAIGYVNE